MRKTYILLLFILFSCDDFDLSVKSLDECKIEAENLHDFIEKNIESKLEKYIKGSELVIKIEKKYIDKLESYRKLFQDCVFLDTKRMVDLRIKKISKYHYLSNETFVLSSHLKSINEINEPRLIKILLEDAAKHSKKIKNVVNQ